MSLDFNTNLTFGADILQNEQAAFAREWLVTNGMGGYASSSIGGANTRRYHGLLVAALKPPVGRAVLLSKLDETLEWTDESGAMQTFALSANLYPGVTAPQGFQFLQQWTAYPCPTWLWSPRPGLSLEKRVWIPPGSNSVCVAYSLREAPAGGKAILRLLPLLAWKDFHTEMTADPTPIPAVWTPPDSPSLPGTLTLTLPGVWEITPGAFPVTLFVRDEAGKPFPRSEFEAKPDWYYYFQHPRERERGLNFEEDLYTPGTLSLPLEAGQTGTILASVDAEPVNLPSAWATYVEQQETLRASASDDAFAQLLALAAHQFLIHGDGIRTTVIAGYPGFPIGAATP